MRWSVETLDGHFADRLELEEVLDRILDGIGDQRLARLASGPSPARNSGANAPTTSSATPSARRPGAEIASCSTVSGGWPGAAVATSAAASHASR